MIDFYAEFNKLFPNIDYLSGLHSEVEDAKEVKIEDVPRQPAPFKRVPAPTININREACTAFAEMVDMHADELVIVFNEVLSSDNVMVADAFKKLVATTKLVSEVGEKLQAHREYVRTRQESSDIEQREWRKRVALRKKQIKDKEAAVKAAEAKYRKEWLSYVRDLEKRFSAAGGDLKKLAADDAAVITRANRGTKVKKPFDFLRNQKGEKCVQLLRDVRSDLRRKTGDRGVKAALKSIGNVYHLADTLNDMEVSSANELFDAFVRRQAFKVNEDGYPALDADFVRSVLPIGIGRKLRSAQGWHDCLAMQEERDIRFRKYGWSNGQKVRIFDTPAGGVLTLSSYDDEYV